MKCPICGKELEMRNKQIGTNENGDPIFNEYAICRDCRKQWNLDKQRAKKAAAKKAAPAAQVKADSPVKKEAPKQAAPEKQAEPVKKEAPKKAASKQPAAEKKDAPKQTVTADGEAPKKRPPRPADGQKKPAPPRKRPEKPAEGEGSDTPAKKKPVKKRPVKKTEPEDEKRYSNLPPEKVRTKRGTAARKNYEEMLETGTIQKSGKKKKTQRDEDNDGMRKASSAKSAPEKRNAPAKTSSKKYEPETDEYDDDYYDDEPRFRVMRIILGIISLLGFGYFIYRGFITGLADTSSGGSISSGTTFIILALCMLVSALLYFIMLKRATIFAFLLPMIFYLGSAVFAFLQRGDDMQLLIAAIASAVLAVISLILAITSRGGDYEDDYDDAFEDDYADEDYDD